MANQQNSYTGSQGTGTNNADFAFTFPSFTTGEVKVEVDNVVKTLTTHYTVEDYNTTSGGKVRFTTNNIPTGTTPVRIFRQTDVDNPKATFTAGSSLKAGEINDNFKQVRHALQEAIGAVATDRKVQRFNIEADSIDGTLIADDVINSEHYVAGSIDHEHLANDIIDGSNIQDDVINSEHYVAGSIDEEHIANSAVTSNKIADNAVTTTEILNGAVTRAKLEADIIDGTKLADNAVDSEHYTDGSIDRVHLEADIIDSTKLADNAVNSEHYVDGSIDHVHLANDIIDGDNIQDDVVNSEHIAAGALDNEHYAAGSITSDKLSGATVVTNSEQSGYSVNDTSFFTTSAADARYFNISTGDTIKNGDAFPDNDTTIATTAAINDRIVDLVEEVGGFIPIANETSFPANNPDINAQHGQQAGRLVGTIISVKEASTDLTPSGTTVTIANGRGSGLAVIITGVPSTISQGFGFLVETTATDHTYAFHRLTPKATEVTTVAGKATEIGRLGTAAAVEDMSILGTTDVVADLAILGTTDVVSDMNALAVSDVISDMNTLAVTDVINDMDTVATNVTNVNNVGGSIANVNTTAGSIANVNTVAGSISNVNTVGGAISNVNTTAGSISNVNTVASNISSVNSFANTYRIGASNPTTSLDVGDLFFNTTSDSLKVYTGSAWVDGVTQTGDFALKTGNTFTGSNVHNDNVKSLYGTGSDLEIFHDGSHSRIEHIGGNFLLIETDALALMANSVSEYYIQAFKNSYVALYYDNSKKFETESTGVHVTGNVSITGDYLADDNEKIKFGDGHDFQIFHDGSANYIKGINDQFLYFATNNTTRWSIANDGHLRPQANQTYDIGSTVQQVKQAYAKEFIVRDDGYFKAGNSADLQIYHDGSHSYVSASGTGALKLLGNNNDDVQIQPRSGYNSARFKPNGAVELYYDNSKKLQTVSSGIEILGTEGVNAELFISADEGDDNNDKHKLVAFNNEGRLGFYNYTSGGWEQNLDLKGNGAVDLYYDNAKKFETTSTGATVSSSAAAKLHVTSADNSSGMILLGPSSNNDAAQIWYDDYANSMYYRTTTNTPQVWYTNNTQRLVLQNDGHLRPYADSSYDLGTSSYRWRNLYADTLYGDGSNLTGINTDLVSDTSPQLGGDLDSNGHHIVITDGEELRLGNDHDTKIRFNGSKSQIVSSVQFDIDADIVDIHNAAANITKARFLNNQVELYYNNSKKFETTISGAKLSGHLYLDDDYRLRLGTGDDLNIYHNGLNSYVANSTGWLVLGNGGSGTVIKGATDENAIACTANGAVELYYDNSNKLQTSSDGISVSGDIRVPDNEQIILGTHDDMQIVHTPNNGYFKNTTGSLYIQNATQNTSVFIRAREGEESIKTSANSNVELYYDNAKKFETTSDGVQVTGKVLAKATQEPQIELQDSDSSHTGAGAETGIRFRDGAGTLQSDIGHYDSSSSNFKLNVAINADIQFSTNNTNRVSIGAGGLNPAVNNTYDLGTSSLRWRNVYTNDLNLSNEGSSNDVDGTWGDWTMQEGESDLFLKNNRSGKKYKFNLTEVS